MSNRERIPLSNEIKALNLYLKLEKMRFEEDFNYEINTDNITSDTTMIPSMLIQPYVENAVKHGLLHKKGLKNVQVVFGQDKNSLMVEVIDNGIGIEASTKINAIRNKKHNSFASEANKKRLEILNANAKDNIGIETITLKNEQQQTVGTKVIIKIPII
jgi:LytS/YehU family sensor histidine kinase